MMHKGDIILNHWASVDNPSRISIITHIGKEFTQALFLSKGNLVKCRFYTRELKQDKEHFEIIDHIDFEKPMRDKLKQLRSDNNGE
jgi:hypothetical protein